MDNIEFSPSVIKAIVGATISVVAFGCAGHPMLRLPTPGSEVVSGHERCAPTQNGAHDCDVAGNKLCRANAFEGGRSFNTQTEYCLEGGHASADCVFVTRAACY
jgi:hypothetical protein